MTAYRLDVKGVPAARKLIDDVGRRAMTPQPVLRAAGEILEEGLRRNFETEGAHLGKPWPQLAAATIERKARQGQSSELMVASGELRDSLTGGSGAVKRVTPFSIRVGTKDFVARFKQGGTGHEPQRKVVGVARQDRAAILELVRRYLIR